MQDRQAVYELVKETIVEYLGGQGASLKRDSMLDEEFGLDSTEMVCVAVDLEKRLGVSLKDVRFGSLQTPDDVVNAVWALLPHARQTSDHV
jgi:acyl carrier protein